MATVKIDTRLRHRFRCLGETIWEIPVKMTAVTLAAYPIVHKDHDGAVCQRSNSAQSQSPAGMAWGPWDRGERTGGKGRERDATMLTEGASFARQVFETDWDSASGSVSACRLHLG